MTSSSGKAALPAALGGKPALVAPLPPWPQADERHRDNILKVLETDQWWSKGGTQVKRFENRFADTHGAKAGLACANGTHALELALRTLGIGPGDEVIVPSMTFIATSMAVMLVGARPIPVDVDRGTWTLDPEATRDAITPLTRAIIPVHFAGHICDMQAIGTLGKEHGLTIIEDAAHAHGARRQGCFAGSFGEMSIFSFQNFKLMTAGEGGILLANDQNLIERASLIANCGRPDGDRAYSHDVLGTNSRLTEFQGAILNAQLDRMEELAERRSKRAEHLRELLSSSNAIRLQSISSEVDRHSFYMVVFECDATAMGGLTRDGFVSALNAEGVPAYRNYPRVQDTGHFAPVFREMGGDPSDMPKCTVSAHLAKTGVWLHHRILIGDTDVVEQTADAIFKVIGAGEHLRAQTMPDA